MDQRKLSRPTKLQYQCITATIDRLTQVGRPNSIEILPLPPLLVQQIEGIRQWKLDMVILLNYMSPYYLPSYVDLPNTPPFSEHFRWTNDYRDDSIKIDRRSTADAQLANYDPSVASQYSIEFAFALASTYCLEDHIRRLFPYWSPLGSSTFDWNPMVRYWSVAFMGSPNLHSVANYLSNIHSDWRGSSDFWLAVTQSFWSIAEGLGEVEFRIWAAKVLRYALKYRHKSVVEFVWAQHTEDDSRESLINWAMFGSLDFIKLVILADERAILAEIIRSGCYRSAHIWIIVKEICDDYKKGPDSELFERLMDCMRDERVHIFVDEIAEPLCEALSKIWKVLWPKTLLKISNDFIDLLRYAIEFGQLGLAMGIWIEDHQQQRRMEMLFRDECAAFRSSCAKGLFHLVQSFWEWASPDQRRRMIECKAGDALNSAARNGQHSVVRYLQKNMDPPTACQPFEHMREQ